MDYISREAALNFEMSVECSPDEIQGVTDGMALYAEYIKQLPSADVVEVVHGEWLRTPTWWVYCSVCGCEPPQETNATTRFCPNCGAKMDGGDRE